MVINKQTCTVVSESDDTTGINLNLIFLSLMPRVRKHISVRFITRSVYQLAKVAFGSLIGGSWSSGCRKTKRSPGEPTQRVKIPLLF